MAAATSAREAHTDRDEAPREEEQAPSKEKKAEGADKPKPMSRRTKIILAIVVVVLAIGGLAYYLYSRGYEDTDDAQIDGNATSLSPRVTGTVKAVLVEDNQRVRAGDPLVLLDPADLDVALAQATAQVTQAEAELQAEDPNVPITETTNKTSQSTAGTDLASSEATLAASQADIAQLTAQLVQAEASARTAELEKERGVRLYEKGAISASEFDNRNDTALAASANVDAASKALDAAKARADDSRAKVEAAAARLEEVRANAPRQIAAHKATVEVRKANLALARAQLEQARLNRSYATITAPVTGIVGKKSVNPGDRVSPGQELMAISETDHLWVTANFRETQLEKIRPGQKVKVHVDAIGMDFTGEVESEGGATGSRYSVLPPENATGNYVKVVQRIGVRIKLDEGQKGMDRLRQGMSVEPKVTLK